MRDDNHSSPPSMTDRATARIPSDLLAAALRESVGIRIDPGSDNFESRSSRVLRAVLADDARREAFFKSLDEHWQRWVGDDSPYPENAGPMVLLEDDQVFDDGMDDVEPTGWVAPRPTVGMSVKRKAASAAMKHGSIPLVLKGPWSEALGAFERAYFEFNLRQRMSLSRLAEKTGLDIPALNRRLRQLGVNRTSRTHQDKDR